MSNTMDIEYYLHGKDKAVTYFLKKKTYLHVCHGRKYASVPLLY